MQGQECARARGCKSSRVHKAEREQRQEGWEGTRTGWWEAAGAGGCKGKRVQGQKGARVGWHKGNRAQAQEPTRTRWYKGKRAPAERTQGW